jgi:hypothetical protein
VHGARKRRTVSMERKRQRVLAQLGARGTHGFMLERTSLPMTGGDQNPLAAPLPSMIAQNVFVGHVSASFSSWPAMTSFWISLVPS